MEDQAKQVRREDVYSKAVRAGKRTYFFDVKATKNNQYYLTITESKRRFNSEQGKFFYEKHKVFLYQEDFDKFTDGLHEVIGFIHENQEQEEEPKHTADPAEEIKKEAVDVSFEDLGKDDIKAAE